MTKTALNTAQKSNAAKELAKQRIKNILMRDRVDIAPNVMQLAKDDMISVAAEYFNVNEQESEIYLTGMKKPGEQDSQTYLVCLIPVNKMNN